MTLYLTMAKLHFLLLTLVIMIAPSVIGLPGPITRLLSKSANRGMEMETEMKSAQERGGESHFKWITFRGYETN